MKTKDMEAALQPTKKKVKPVINTSNSISSGSTILNLACTGRPRCGFPVGTYVLIVGDSASGKTWLSLTCLAEAAINPKFDNYRFIYDNAEGGARMDFKKYFGEAAAKRIEPPSKLNGRPVNSTSIEEFYFHADDALKEERPFIYILDSMDVLTSREEREKFIATKNAMRKETAVAGTMTDGKAKKNASYLRQLLTKLMASDSILIIINQTRDNLAFGFAKKTNSGGHALRFYACLEIWSAINGRIKKTVRGKPRTIGIRCGLKIKKNRFTGQEHQIEIPIYYSHGFDEIGSCVDYLADEGHWPSNKKTGTVHAQEWDFKGTREKLVQYIETNELENELRSIVFDIWKDIENQCKVLRKKRY